MREPRQDTLGRELKEEALDAAVEEIDRVGAEREQVRAAARMADQIERARAGKRVLRQPIEDRAQLDERARAPSRTLPHCRAG